MGTVITDMDKYVEISKLKSKKHSILLLFKLSTLVVFYLLVVSGWKLFQVHNIDDWQPVKAVVERSEYSHVAGKSMGVFDFLYAYELDNKKFTSSQVGLYPLWIGRRGVVNKMEGLSREDIITVFVDPDRPDFAYFDNNIDGYQLQFYIFLLYIILIFMLDKMLGGISIFKLKNELKEFILSETLK